MNKHLICIGFAAIIGLAGVGSAGDYSGGGAGTEADPYRIATAADMNNIGAHPNDWGSHFVLVNDINLADYTGTQFNIIGYYINYSDNKPFTGVFDGNGHKISNFTYKGSPKGGIGLFGCLWGPNAQIKDLGLIDPNIIAGTEDYVGTLVGKTSYYRRGGATITNCYVEGGSVQGCEKVGGLVGYNYYSTISNCCSSASVTGDSRTGGLVGFNNIFGTISNCYATGSVSGGMYYTGGMVGFNDLYGTISNCYASGSVIGNVITGGLVGYNCDEGMISNCYAEGSFSGDVGIGGLVGSNGGMISNCYATGSVSGTTSTGGLVGYGPSKWAKNCFWDVETSGQWQSTGGTGKTTAEMKTASTFFGWAVCDNEGLWTIDEGNDYPRFSWQNIPSQPLPVQQLSDFVTGSGTAADPYLIYTAEQLNLIGRFSCEWDNHFLLENDIDLSGFTGIEFNIIGNHSDPFTGVFDGNDYTILKFTYTTVNTDYIGFFGCVDDANALIKDLTLVTPDVNAAGSSRYVGCLVGLLRDGTITGCGTDGGQVRGDNYTGGLVGENHEGTISNCYAEAIVTGDWSTGGLVGQNSGFHSHGTISNCYATGSISGGSYSTGGLVGENNYGTISNCYAVAGVTGTDYTGGLVGRNWYDQDVISASFWDIEIGGPDNGLGTPLPTSQMMTKSTFTDAGWDFVGEVVNGPNDIWRMCVDGLNYPMLWWEFIDGDFVCPDGVNFIDYSFFAGHWLEDNCAGTNDCEGSDLDQSGDVDINDVKILSGNWLEGL